MAGEPFEVVDSSGLTDADWAHINEIKRIYQTGGTKALNKALAKLAKDDPLAFTTLWGAFFPDMLREAIKDSMAEIGMEEDDLRELVRKLESPARDQ